MKGIPVPPRDEDFAADASELFFDLVFVVALSRLVSHLGRHPDWSGVGKFLLLFSLIWMPWTQFTWSANAVAGNSRPVRALFLVATVVSVPMAASVSTAFEGGGPAFAGSSAIILAMGLFILIAGLSDEDAVRASAVRYSVPNWAAIAALIGGSFVQGAWRVGAWLLAIGIVLIGTLRAGSDEWLVRPGHFAERHALIVIVALGEVIVALGIPVAAALESAEGLSAGTFAALLAAGLFAALLWWAYFDRPSPALELRHEALVGGLERGRFARDVFTYAHFPLVAGVLLATAGLQQVAQHPADTLPGAFRAMLAGGLALYLGAVAAAVHVAFKVVAKERLFAAAGIGLLVAAGGALNGVVLLVLIDVALAIMLVVEHRRIERPAEAPA